MLTSLKMDVSQSWRNGNILCPNSVKTKVPYENVNVCFIVTLCIHIQITVTHTLYITVMKTKKTAYHFEYVGL